MQAVPSQPPSDTERILNSKDSNMRFSSAEMEAIDPKRAQQAVALPDGGYFATLTVFHELHCLVRETFRYHSDLSKVEDQITDLTLQKRLHRYMYPSSYFPNLSDQEMEDNRFHNEHCIDMLRQSVMCHGDISPVTMRWGQTQPIPLGNFSSPHECVNWAAINEWAKERSVEKVIEPGYLKHPRFGVVVDENFDNKIGQLHHED